MKKPKSIDTEGGAKVDKNGYCDAVYNCVLGIDVHSSQHVCTCTHTEYPPDSPPRNVTVHKVFGTKAKDLKALVDWVVNFTPDIEIIACESTGIFWIPLYTALEAAGIPQSKIWVLNAQEVKAVAGKKTDEQDSERICNFVRMGNGRPSFVPSYLVRSLRSIGRRIIQLAKRNSQDKNCLHREHNLAGMFPSAVFSDLSGKAASAILETAFAYHLGAMTQEELKRTIREKGKRLKASPDEILEALLSQPSEGSLIALGSFKRELAFHTKELEYLEHELWVRLEFYFPEEIKLLESIPGVGQKCIMTILSEIGDQITHFRNSKAFCSWLGLVPGNCESGGKKYHTRCTRGNKFIRTALIECAQALSHSKNNSLVDTFKVLKERRGYNKAIVALAHKIARITYAVLTKRVPYEAKNSNVLREHRIERFQRAEKGLKEVGLKPDGNGGIVEKEPSNKQASKAQRKVDKRAADVAPAQESASCVAGSSVETNAPSLEPQSSSASTGKLVRSNRGKGVFLGWDNAMNEEPKPRKAKPAKRSLHDSHQLHTPQRE